MFPELSFELPPPPKSSGRERRGAAEWVAHIREQDMPAFGATVAAVKDITHDDRASASRLAQVILQDAALTTKVLKLANSVFYNPARGSISTISRAIVVLGFNLVADIAIGVALVDAMLAGGVRERVIGEMAQCFHAAVQARAMALARRDPRAEEIFIAALLARVGDMAFWCFGGDVAERLHHALSRSEADPEDVQQAELGFKLRQLSVGLAREWKLGGLLNNVLEGRARSDPAEQSIVLGQKLSAAVRGGWECRQARAAVEAIAKFTGESVEELTPELQARAEEAAHIADYYGVGEAARLIPRPNPAAPGPPADPPAVAPSGPDPMLQLHILRELSGLIAADGKLNDVLNLALEGILRGIGLDRVLFAMMTPNRAQLVGKSGLGQGVETLAERFIFAVEGPTDELVNAVLLRGKSFLLEAGKSPSGGRPTRLRSVTGDVPACVAPIAAQGKIIGLFYGDNAAKAGAIDGESFESFAHFVQQVSLAFDKLARRG
jgi:HD-like signal output (HDOD) protein